VPIEHSMVTKAIERAQKQVEAQNFATRKHLLEYDDVMNKQRENVYSLRRELLEGSIKLGEEETVDSRGYITAVAEELVEDIVETHAGAEQDAGPGTDFETVAAGFVSVTPLQVDLTRHAALPGLKTWLERLNG